MIAVDTKILVYSVRADSPWHAQAREAIRGLAEGDEPWAIAWPCIHEFVGVVTHPRIYKPPTSLADALLQVEYWAESPGVRFLGEGSGYWRTFAAAATGGKVAGPVVHDARVAAICIAGGVREIWTRDRDFSRFPKIRARNPLDPFPSPLR